MQDVRVQALRGGSKSPTSRYLEARSIGLCVKLQGVQTLVLVEGVAYIECARTPASPRYKGFNVHKDKTLLVTRAIKSYK